MFAYNFNHYDFKRAVKNFIQLFIIGYITIILLLFIGSVTSDYGFEKTVNDFSLELISSPIFWLFPFIVAMSVGVMRGFKYEDVDITDEAALARYCENKKWKNQPAWFKVLSILIVSLYLYIVLSEEGEVSQSKIEIMKAEAVAINSAELYQNLNVALGDGKVMRSEFRDFMNKSMKIQFQSLNNKTN